MKKKLEDAYMPDKEGRRSRVLVGLSGGIHSFVTAYLLKIQKYELTALTVLTSEKKADGTLLYCQIQNDKLEAIKSFCKTLGISHIQVSANDSFDSQVIDPWLADRLIGKATSPCWNCHDLRMSILFQKANEMGIPQVATGHFAKIYRNDAHGTVYIHSGNDEIKDQSALLSRLPGEYLDKLLLPLSDLQEKEVLKLAENFGVSSALEGSSVSSCLSSGDKVSQLIESQAPKKFLRQGEVYDSENEKLGDHLGVQFLAPGSPIQIKDSVSNIPPILGKYVPKENKAIAVKDEYFLHKELILTKCKISEETPWFEPFRAVLKRVTNEVVECWVYPKNINNAFIVCDHDIKVIEGEMVSVLKRKGKNSKVFFTGQVKYLIQENKPEGSEVEKNKFNPAIDF